MKVDLSGLIRLCCCRVVSNSRCIIHGLDRSDEENLVYSVPFDEVSRLLLEGRVESGAVTFALQWLALFRLSYWLKKAIRLTIVPKKNNCPTRKTVKANSNVNTLVIILRMVLFLLSERLTLVESAEKLNEV